MCPSSSLPPPRLHRFVPLLPLSLHPALPPPLQSSVSFSQRQKIKGKKADRLRVVGVVAARAMVAVSGVCGRDGCRRAPAAAPGWRCALGDEETGRMTVVGGGGGGGEAFAAA